MTTEAETGTETETEPTETGTETATETETSTETKTDSTDWKAKAREWEKRAKANSGKASEYDKLVAASQSDLERAQEAARLSDQKAADAIQRAAASEIKAAVSDVVPAEVLGDLNLAKFVDADGNIDADAVAELRGRFEKLGNSTNGARTPAPTPGQGTNTEPGPGQLTREQLKTMSPGEIVEAKEKGLLNDLLGIKK